MTAMPATTTIPPQTPTTARANPTFWSAYRSEIYRWSRHGFYKFVVIFGLLFSILAFIFIVLLGGERYRQLFSDPNVSIGTGAGNVTGVDLGNQGAVAFAGNTVLPILTTVMGLVFVIAMLWNIAQEFSWRTLKMVATRQPSRTQYVLVKTAAGATVIILMTLSIILGWLIFGFGTKLLYSGSAITSGDTEALQKGLRYMVTWTFGMFIWGLVTFPILFRFKSLIGAVIFYIAYNAIDSSLSQLGTFIRIGRVNLEQFEGVTRTVYEFIRNINPYLITTNFDALIVKRNALTAAATLETPEAAFARLVVWAVILIGITITIYRLRDITE